MHPALIKKLDSARDRHHEVSGYLADPNVIADQEKFRKFSVEYAQLSPLVDRLNQYQATLADMASAEEMLKDKDRELQELAQQELEAANQRKESIELDLQRLLIPPDPNDNCNIFLEVRAGTGGDEAALFAGDLFRMYSRFAETQRWGVEIISESLGEVGGYKEVIFRISGQGVYSKLKFESGVHRVQRVPETEAQGRVHTSACTVAVLPEVEEINSIEINPSDLRTDTYRASGAGGQHVNKTDSAVRITHIPTGIVIECQDERSQHKNRSRAMSLLKAKLLAVEKEKQLSTQAESRRLQVGTGDRSERIRTYNFPQGRLTDHRVNLTLYSLETILAGDLDPVTQPLAHEYQVQQISDLIGEKN